MIYDKNKDFVIMLHMLYKLHIYYINIINWIRIYSFDRYIHLAFKTIVLLMIHFGRF